MKTISKMLFALCILTAATTFAQVQDLGIEIYSAKRWVVTPPSDVNCATQMGYTPFLKAKDTVIRFELDIINWGDTDAVIPNDRIWYNPCRQQNEVIGLITQSIFNKCGQLIHSHLDGTKLWDYATNEYWKQPDANCIVASQYDSSRYARPSETAFGISEGCHYRTNSYPNGYQLAISYDHLPDYDTVLYVVNVNLNQSNNCHVDTAKQWYLINKGNGLFEKVSAPQPCGFRTEPPCSDFTPISNLTIDADRNIHTDGSCCTVKMGTRYVMKGNKVLIGTAEEFMYRSCDYKDTTALTQSKLQAFTDQLPDVKGKAPASYRYVITDAQVTLTKDKVTYPD